MNTPGAVTAQLQLQGSVKESCAFWCLLHFNRRNVVKVYGSLTEMGMIHYVHVEINMYLITVMMNLSRQGVASAKHCCLAWGGLAVLELM